MEQVRIHISATVFLTTCTANDTLFTDIAKRHHLYSMSVLAVFLYLTVFYLFIFVLHLIFSFCILYCSFIGSKVRLPGESASTPNIYEFGTPYHTMVKDLTNKNKDR